MQGRRRAEVSSPVTPPPSLAREWRRRLAESGFRDIEYADESLLGISVQEPERAPDIVELDATTEYYSRASEYLHAATWRGRRNERAVWASYSEGASLRDIASAQGLALTTLYRLVERLRAECDRWWQETTEERTNPKPCAGRPRKEEPRRMQLLVRLTRAEMLALRSAAHRAGAVRSHQIGSWIRGALISAAESTPYKKAT